MTMPFTIAHSMPPINYGIQTQNVGRGGPGMALNSFAQHLSGWPPRWKATMLPNFMLPYGAASSKRTIPINPNLWTAYGIPTNNVAKAGTSTLTF